MNKYLLNCYKIISKSVNCFNIFGILIMKIENFFAIQNRKNNRTNKKKFLYISLFTIVILFIFINSTYHISANMVSKDSNNNDSKYHNYNELSREFQSITSKHPEITKLHNIGTTYENRTIWAIKISDNPQLEEAEEPDILIMGCHHARELISVEVPLFFANYLVENYEINADVKNLVDNREIWIIPMLNPDGHVYVEEGHTNWRKNRIPIDEDDDGKIDAYGVDLNRNYAYEWGVDEHTSDEPGNEFYHGKEPFSEKESQAIRDLANEHNFVASISFHSYGESISYPWGYTEKKAPDNDLFEKIATNMARYSGYEVMQNSKIYPARGDSEDWLYGEKDILAFTIELAESHKPKESKIEEICEKNLDSILYLCEIADNPEKVFLPDWTFITYMAGDNTDDLSEQVSKDLNAMKSVGSTSEINIVALADQKGEDNTHAYFIKKNQLQEISLDKINPSWEKELDMSKPETLRDFVKWSIENYPAQHYFLDIWDHGEGWIRVCYEGKITHNDNLNMEELRGALSQIIKAGNITKFDIIGFDACSMGMFEVGYQISDFSKYMIASEKEEPTPGWPYNSILSKLTKKSYMDSRELCTIIVEDYVEAYQNGSLDNHDISVALSAVDLALLENNIADVNAFAQTLKNRLSLNRNKIKDARNDAENYEQSSYIDLADLANKIKEKFDDEEIDLTARNIMENVETSVFANNKWCDKKDSGACKIDNANGLTLYFPNDKNRYKSEYENLNFSIDTVWDEFLNEYYNGRKNDEYFINITIYTEDFNEDGFDELAYISYNVTTTEEIENITIEVDVLDSKGEYLTKIHKNLTIYEIENKNRKLKYYAENSDKYTFLVKLFDEKGNEEDSAIFTNIELTLGMVDLEPTSVKIYREDCKEVNGLSTHPIVGEKTKIEVTVFNYGTADASYTEVMLYDNGKLIGSVFTSIQKDNNSRINITNIFTEGVHTLKIIVSPRNEKDKNSDNNQIIQTIYVKSNKPEKHYKIYGFVYCKDGKSTINNATITAVNLRNNKTIISKTDNGEYTIKLDSKFYLDGDKINLTAEYNNTAYSKEFMVYSEDSEINYDFKLNFTPYYEINIICMEYTKKVKIGETIEFTIIVENKGNIQDTLDFTLYNIPEFCNVSISKRSIVLSPRESINLTLTIKIPLNESTGTVNFTFNCTSLGGSMDFVNLSILIKSEDDSSKIDIIYLLIVILLTLSIISGTYFMKKKKKKVKIEKNQILKTSYLFKMNYLSKICLLLFLMAVLILIPKSSASEDDWVVTNFESLNNETIYFEGNLIIQKDGDLKLDNCVLKINTTNKKIIVQSKGALSVHNSLIEANNSKINYKFEVYGELVVDNSRIKNLWGTGIEGGIQIYSSNAIITNTTISKSKGSGIWCKGSQKEITEPIIIGNNIVANSGAGIYCEYSSPLIKDNSIKYNED